MMRFAMIFGLLAGPPAPPEAPADSILLPSGLMVRFLDMISDAPGLGVAYRFRFVSSDLAADQDYITTENDMAHLCRTYALPRVEDADPQPEAIVITLSDRPVPFGSSDPDAVQFFEAYRPVGGECEWHEF